ncbi:phosphopantetheine-binding protein [Streptomyces sp. NPDC048420]|uniref:acyl carrier protein n=1 Tax=Streptomyces sp. NPDC048420 TaxID=3155755 RepID=UPI00343000A4
MTDSVATMISEILTGKFDVLPEDVTNEAVLEDLDLDSLALVELSLILEQRLGISIGDGTLNSRQTIDQAAGAVDALAAAEREGAA